MEQQNDIHAIFRRYLSGNYTTADVDMLIDYFGVEDNTEDLTLLINNELKREADHNTDWDRVERIRLAVADKLNRKVKPKPNYGYYIKIAAILLGFLGIFYLIYHLGVFNTPVKHDGDQLALLDTIQDIPPGGNRATITLSDGTTVSLSEDQEGIIADATGLTYNDGGQVIEAKPEVTYATLSTPRGGQYQLTLPDGTKVWLNAQSEITYPLHFDDTERKVELQGEAYFEVTHNPQQPFYVQSAAQKVKVLGTAFNIRSYQTQIMQTTLIEGAIAVELAGKISTPITLNPGQQLTVQDEKTRVSNVKISSYTGWKDGMFIFHDLPLSEVLVQIEKWYDIQIPHTDIPDSRVFGEISRDTQLSRVLELLETATNLKFEVRERRLTIKK